jgi:hypothetical protein
MSGYHDSHAQQFPKVLLGCEFLKFVLLLQAKCMNVKQQQKNLEIYFTAVLANNDGSTLDGQVLV